jgi:hypothetical protein
MSNCAEIVEKYLLFENPIYTFSLPISILFGIIVFGIVQTCDISKNSYVNQLLIPLASIFILMVLIDIIARYMISPDVKNKLIRKCHNWKNKDMNSESPKLQRRDQIKVRSLDKDDLEDLLEKRASKRKELKNIEKFETYNSSNSHEATGEKDEFDNDKEDELDNDKEDDKEDEVLQSKSTESIKLNNNYNNTKNNLMNNVCDYEGTSKTSLHPSSLSFDEYTGECLLPTTDCNFCSGGTPPPEGLTVVIPSPQWMPETARFVQERLKNGNYTAAKC